MTVLQGNKDSNEVDSTSDGPLSGSFHASTSTASASLSNSTVTECLLEPRQATEPTQRKELTRTRSLDRSNDHVYAATTKVVKAIMQLSRCVDRAAAAQYLDLVLNVGVELRMLLSSVDTLASSFPSLAMKYNKFLTYFKRCSRLNFFFNVSVHREVEMAHKVLAKDMSELVATMRLAQQYCETTLDVEYRK